MDTIFCVFTLMLCTVCYGQVHNNIFEESTSEKVLMSVDVNETTNSTFTPVLQNSYNNDNAPRGVVIGVPIVSLLLIGCCIYYCCRCRSQRNQGVVMNLHSPPPVPAPAPTQIIIQQHAGSQPPAPQPPVPQTAIPPQYPAQQHFPPPYDTQPMWKPQQQQYQQQPPQQQYHQQAPPPPQQQFHQQAQQIPTSYDNPNYAQPPTNMQYGQEKY